MKVASHVFAHFPRLARGGRLPIFRYCAPWKTPVTLHSPKNGDNHRSDNHNKHNKRK